jgi:hypothetical protein
MDAHPRRAALPVACLALLAACGSSGGTHLTGPAPTTAATVTQTPSTAATQVNGTAALPTTCGALPQSLISTDLGGIGATMALKDPAPGVSCEFANSSGSKILIVTVGHGTAADLARLQAQIGSSQTVTPVPGFEAGAFTVSRNGLVRGFTAVTSNGLLIVVSSTLTAAQDEALIQQIAGG